MNEFVLIPKVDQAQEFIEIANDFANPLDLVREAISDAFDSPRSKEYSKWPPGLLLAETTLNALGGVENPHSYYHFPALKLDLGKPVVR